MDAVTSIPWWINMSYGHDDRKRAKTLDIAMSIIRLLAAVLELLY